jgi:hypothetical protein
MESETLVLAFIAVVLLGSWAATQCIFAAAAQCSIPPLRGIVAFVAVLSLAIAIANLLGYLSASVELALVAGLLGWQLDLGTTNRSIRRPLASPRISWLPDRSFSGFSLRLQYLSSEQ